MKIITTTFIATLFAIKVCGQCETLQTVKDYIQKNISTIDPIEGLWSLNLTISYYDYGKFDSSTEIPQYETWAIIRNANNFIHCLINDNFFTKTAFDGVYLFQNKFSGGYVAKANAFLTNGSLIEISYEIPTEGLRANHEKFPNGVPNGVTCKLEYKFIKLFPTIDDIQKFSPSSGTGFAISSNGLIITNHHVIDGANNIGIRGINGDFSKTYKAKVVVEDRNNDLAILKIDDISFSSLGAVPYLISNKSSDVGCSVFCLGYPLRATMGEEVKLTNGIISSKSGFKDDITSYQITAPIQAGNSGGPLFDDKGNLIGIINAKHLGAENVSYAIKVSYLLNLIDILPTIPKLQTINTLGSKSLSEQVKIIKNFTYIIETN